MLRVWEHIFTLLYWRERERNLTCARGADHLRMPLCLALILHVKQHAIVRINRDGVHDAHEAKPW